MGDAILRIPRDARVRAYRTRDTYDGVVPATSKRQPYCHSSYIELSVPAQQTVASKDGGAYWGARFHVTDSEIIAPEICNTILVKAL